MNKHLALIKAAVIPLAKNKPELQQLAKDITTKLKKARLGRIALENTGNMTKLVRHFVSQLTLTRLAHRIATQSGVILLPFEIETHLNKYA